MVQTLRQVSLRQRNTARPGPLSDGPVEQATPLPTCCDDEVVMVIAARSQLMKVVFPSRARRCVRKKKRNQSLTPGRRHRSIIHADSHLQTSCNKSEAQLKAITTKRYKRGQPAAAGRGGRVTATVATLRHLRYDGRERERDPPPPTTTPEKKRKKSLNGNAKLKGNGGTRSTSGSIDKNGLLLPPTPSQCNFTA